MIHMILDVLTLTFVFLTFCGMIHVSRVLNADVHPISPISSDEDVISKHVKEREETFDQRIAQIKEELALRTNTRNIGHIADELDPNVKNLPHHTLDMQRDAEPEYAD